MARNQYYNLDKPMQQLQQIHIASLTNPYQNFDKSMYSLNKSMKQLMSKLIQIDSFQNLEKSMLHFGQILHQQHSFCFCPASTTWLLICSTVNNMAVKTDDS